MTKEQLLSELKGLRGYFEENNYNRCSEELGICWYLYKNTNWYTIAQLGEHYVKESPFVLIRQICATLKLEYSQDMGPKNRKMVIDLLEHDLTIAAEYL